MTDRSGRTHGIAGPTLVLVQSGKLFMVSAALEEPHYFSSQILLKKWIVIYYFYFVECLILKLWEILKHFSGVFC